jgi:hypothetical protein
MEVDGDDTLAVKDNEKTLREGRESLSEHAHEPDSENVEHDFHGAVDLGHGRAEIRSTSTISDPDFVDRLDPNDRMSGLYARISGTSCQEFRFSLIDGAGALR